MRGALITSSLIQIALIGCSYAQCFNVRQCDPNAITVQTQVTVTMPMGAGSDLTQRMESARQSLSRVVERQCDLLKDSFKGECSVRSLNIATSAQNFGNGPQVSATLNGTYEVKPK